MQRLQSLGCSIRATNAPYVWPVAQTRLHSFALLFVLVALKNALPEGTYKGAREVLFL